MIVVRTIDVTESHITRNGVHLPVAVVVAKNISGKVVRVYITDIPFEAYVACGSNFQGAVDTAQQVNSLVIRQQNSCRRTNCENKCVPLYPTKSKKVQREMCLLLRKKTPVACTSAEIVMRRSLEGYQAEQRPFIKFNFTHPCFVRDLYKLYKNLDVGTVLPEHEGLYNYYTDTAYNFIIHKRFYSFGWFTFPGKSDQTDYVVSMDDFQESKDMGNGLIKFAFFDIEVISKTYLNSETQKASYPVGLISVIEPVTLKSVLFVLRGNQTIEVDKIDEPEPNMLTEIALFNTEEELLIAFYHRLLQINPDCIGGYNIMQYDYPYIYRRMQVLGLETFEMSRVPGCPTIFTERLQKVATAVRSVTNIDCPGIVFIDPRMIIPILLKLYNNKLNTVAEHFDLGGKDPVATHQIEEFFNKLAADRKILASYCVKDTWLAMKIAGKIAQFGNLAATCQVLRCNARAAIEEGTSYTLSTKIWQDIKGEFVVRKWEDNYVEIIDEDGELVTVNQKRIPYSLSRIPGFTECHNRKIQGGFVRDPDYKVNEQRQRKAWARRILATSNDDAERVKANLILGEFPAKSFKGLHTVPIATLDFASLYPSLARQHNLDPTTLLHEDHDVPPDQVYTAPNGAKFSQLRRGVIPRAMDELVNARNQVRKEMKTETDPVRYEQKDALQKSLKTAANSYYGQMSSSQTPLSCKLAGEAITTSGQAKAKEVFARIMNNPLFEEFGIEVIYGDTDSLFIALMNLSSREACAKLYESNKAEWIELNRRMVYYIAIEKLLQDIGKKEVTLAEFPSMYLPENVSKQRFPDKITMSKRQVAAPTLRKMLTRSLFNDPESELFQFRFADVQSEVLSDSGYFKEFDDEQVVLRMCKRFDLVEQLVEEFVQVETTRRKFRRVFQWINVDSGILSGYLKLEWEDIAIRLLLTGNKHYFKLVSSVEPGDVLGTYLKCVGQVTRSMTPYCGEMVIELARMLLVERREIIPEIKKYLQRVASNEVPYKELMHSSMLSKPIEEYGEGMQKHVVAARQMRDANIEVVIGDRITYYYCLVSGKNGQKGSQTIAEFLMPNYSLDLKQYVSDMIRSLKIFSLALPQPLSVLINASMFEYASLPTKPAPIFNTLKAAMGTETTTHRTSAFTIKKPNTYKALVQQHLPGASAVRAVDKDQPRQTKKPSKNADDNSSSSSANAKRQRQTTILEQFGKF